MATSVQSEVPMAGSVAKMVNRLSKVDDPILKIGGEPKKLQHSPQLQQLHLVVYRYESQQADELDMEVNDVIEVVKPVEDGWNRGRNQRTGASGMYPTNYCEVMKAKSIGGVSAAASSSQGGSTGKQYSALKKPEIGGGDFPTTNKRVSGMEVFSSSSSSSATTAAATAAAAASTFSSGGARAVLREEKEASPAVHHLPSLVPSPPPPAAAAAAAAASGKEQLQPDRDYARVAFDYVAQHEDELSLKVGQIVWVTNKATTDSGWYEGEVDGRRGLFPDNFVALMTPSEVAAASAALSKQQPAQLAPAAAAAAATPSSSSSTSAPPSGRAGDKPPASLPGAVPVMPLPPQVPAKPPKSGGGGSPLLGGAALGWKTNGVAPAAAAAAPPAAAATITPTAVVREEEKTTGGGEAKSTPPPPTFSQKRAALLASLNMHNPEVPRTNMSKSTTRVDQEDVDENGEVPQLAHPTKSRPKAPNANRRPVSMFPHPPASPFEAGAHSRDGMTRSEMVLNEHPAPVGASVSLSPTTAVSVSPILPPKKDEFSSPLVAASSFSPRSSTGTPTPLNASSANTAPSDTWLDATPPSSSSMTAATTTSSSSHHNVQHYSAQSAAVPSSQQQQQQLSQSPQPPPPSSSASSQWVSRAEHNQLLAKVALLEERLAALERR